MVRILLLQVIAQDSQAQTYSVFPFLIWKLINIRSTNQQEYEQATHPKMFTRTCSVGKGQSEERKAYSSEGTKLKDPIFQYE